MPYENDDAFNNVQTENREYPRYVYHKTKAPVVVNSPEEEDKLKGDWQDLPYHEERDGEDAESETIESQKRPRGRPKSSFGDDHKKELDQKTKHDLEKILPGADDLQGTGYVDQEDAPDAKPKK